MPTPFSEFNAGTGRLGGYLDGSGRMDLVFANSGALDRVYLNVTASAAEAAMSR